MRKRLSNFFQLLSEDMGLLIFAIILCPLWIGIFVQLKSYVGAFEPPSEADYKYLHEQEDTFKDNYENVYLIEGASIKVLNSGIKVILVSETDRDYELHVTFDKNKEFIKSEEICYKEGFRKNTGNDKLEKNIPSFECILYGLFVGVLFALLLHAVYIQIYHKVLK